MSQPAPRKDVTFIQFPDAIDERVDLIRLFNQAKKIVRIDCSQVKRINSVGIRNLKMNLTRLNSAGVKLVFIGLTPPLVEAIDFVSNLLPLGAVVESVYLPFCCKSCREGFLVLCPLKDLLGHTDEIKNIPCIKCGQEAEFDHVPALYFRELLAFK